MKYKMEYAEMSESLSRFFVRDEGGPAFFLPSGFFLPPWLPRQQGTPVSQNNFIQTQNKTNKKKTSN